ncbi:MAG: hypothetical protein J7518_11930 [Nocardioidaceae bacterium]|nr:hypothetical protein [Nocardioidaceae bacterium]
MRASHVVAFSLAVPLLAAAPAAAVMGGTRSYSADLHAINHGGSGSVQLMQHGTTLEVDLRASGLDDGIHIAHIHGIRQAESECPGMNRDADHNGLIDILEGLPDYGPVLRTLSNGLNDRGTSLAYTRTFKLIDNGDAIASLGRLDQYAIVVHGVDLNGDGQANNPDVQGDGPGDPDDNEISMPSLCGVIVSR